MAARSQWRDCSSSSEEEEEEAPLLDREPRVKGLSGSFLLTVLYFCVMAINGAMVGAIGPSIEEFGHVARMSDSALGRLVMQNRLCKLMGTLIWCLYARRLQRPRGKERPHQLFAGLLLLTAASAAATGIARTPVGLQLALLTWGFCYGLTDSGATSLTVWRWYAAAAPSGGRRASLDHIVV